MRDPLTGNSDAATCTIWSLIVAGAGSPGGIDDDDKLRAIHLDCCGVNAHNVLHHRLHQGAFAFDRIVEHVVFFSDQSFDVSR